MKTVNEYTSTLFPGWTEKEQLSFVEKLEKVEIKEGETLFKRGDKAEAFYFLIEGRVGIKKETGFEDKTQVIALLDSGAPIGERGIINAKKSSEGSEESVSVTRGAEVIAVKDSVLYRLQNEAYQRFIGENPVCALQFMEWLLSRISLRLEKASERLAHIL